MTEAITLQIVTIVAVTLYTLHYSLSGKAVTWRRGKEREKISDREGIVSRFQEAELEAVALIANSAVESEADYFIKSIRDGILYSIGRHDWYESQRQLVLKLIFQIASVFLVISGLLFRFSTSLAEPLLVGISSISIISIGYIAFALFYFNKELDGDRPYRLVSDIKIRYFRYNLQDNSAQENCTPRDLMKREGEQRKKFFDRVTKLNNLPSLLREDIEQLYILHVLQRSKQKSLSRLRHILFNFVICLLSITLLTMALSLWVKFCVI